MAKCSTSDVLSRLQGVKFQAETESYTRYTYQPLVLSRATPTV
jgi:hypothetical protein